MRVISDSRGHTVIADEGVVLAGSFASNAEAWRALDRLEGEPLNPSEKRTQWVVDRILTEI